MRLSARRPCGDTLLERGRDHVVDRLQPDELQAVARGQRDLVEVAAIARRQTYGVDARARGGDGLFLDAAHRQHQAAQADLAGHRDVGLHGLAREQRVQRGEHVPAGAGAVVGNGAGRHVDVDVALLEQLEREAELIGAALDEAQGRLRRFLHHVAQLSREYQIAAPRHARGLDEQDIAAHRRPGEAGRDAGHGRAHRALGFKARCAEYRRDVGDVEVDARRGALGDTHRDRAEHAADLALELTPPAPARGAAHYGAQRRIAYGALPPSLPVRALLAALYIAPRDLVLFFLCVCGVFDDLLAVALRARYF